MPIAAKLELGTHQTLAHQDADGNWILNDPPPDPALELAKCQRCYEVVPFETVGSGQIFEYPVPFKVTKRANLTSSNCTIISVNGNTGYISYYNGSNWVDVTATISPMDIGLYMESVRVNTFNGLDQCIFAGKVIANCEL
jgi:hypothetical protein